MEIIKGFFKVVFSFILFFVTAFVFDELMKLSHPFVFSLIVTIIVMIIISNWDYVFIPFVEFDEFTDEHFLGTIVYSITYTFTMILSGFKNPIIMAFICIIISGIIDLIILIIRSLYNKLH